MRLLVGLIVAGVLALPATAAAHNKPPRWVPVATGSTQQHRGLDAVDKKTVWVAGTAGEVLRTTDGGRTWKNVSPPDTPAGLQFRDVEAEGAQRAHVLAIGEGDASRIYRTTDGGRHWDLVFVNDEPTAFYDCMDFFDGGRRGLALSDPVGGKFRILGTFDSGRSWHVLPTGGMPEAVAGEFAFAASGTCLVTHGDRDAWIGSGGGASRVFHSRDGGFTWKVKDAPIPAAEAGGVFSLAFRNGHDGVMVGGDFTLPDNGADASGFTHDGDRWRSGGDLSGYRSGVDWLGDTLIAVGPNGSDVSYDGARRWKAFDDAAYDAVDCVDGTCWASGPAGAVARLDR
ncbi:MAG TPA: hypothetical protein VFX51_08165 [Solirubrobacteraceae bacterium]|nr:hypothetical protein [Solirubrobacteraceae bacterium]